MPRRPSVIYSAGRENVDSQRHQWTNNSSKASCRSELALHERLQVEALFPVPCTLLGCELASSQLRKHLHSDEPLRLYMFRSLFRSVIGCETESIWGSYRSPMPSKVGRSMQGCGVLLGKPRASFVHCDPAPSMGTATILAAHCHMCSRRSLCLSCRDRPHYSNVLGLNPAGNVH